MPVTYDSIATTTIATATTIIDFTSIPTTFTDLKIVIIGTSVSICHWNLTLNGSTATDYNICYLTANGTTASTSGVQKVSNFNLTRALQSSTTVPMMFEINIFNYRSAQAKAISYIQTADRNGSGVLTAGAGLNIDSAAITSARITGTANFEVGTMATLYGIKNA
jgi:hypothetical protein